ncbi:hypothetical protein SAMN04487983_1007153 [Streptomyces sp. yr375]|uniref:hypothetical protein n=1 Tax=Streptomyces sp. yr375 TaxID=1761906 RepID=UPI0008D320F0|nr:hypothetical protein [Streptomyces sp. yr375]SEQ71106.1 hypothetical protein SAMN04487983_1007153 [Streptomyces sp. yr375]
METDRERSTRPPRSSQPPGDPRWVAMFYDAPSASWRQAAESPDRTPVLFAIGEMTQVKRGRGDDFAVDLWGPEGGEWRRFDPVSPVAVEAAVEVAVDASVDASAVVGHAKFAERMEGRRHQVLVAGLSKAGLYDLAPDDVAAVRVLVERVDESTLRRVVHWMAVAGAPGE